MTTELLTELMAQSTAGYFSVLFDITWVQGGVAHTMHLCNDVDDILHNGITYRALAFTYTPPPVSEASVGGAQVSIDMVSQEIGEEILKCSEPPKFHIQAIYFKQNGAIEVLDNWDFTMESTSWNVTTLTGELTFETALDRYVPKDSFDTENAPGCW